MTSSQRIKLEAAKYMIDFYERAEGEWFLMLQEYRKLKDRSGVMRCRNEVKAMRQKAIEYIIKAARLSHEAYAYEREKDLIDLHEYEASQQK